MHLRPKCIFLKKDKKYVFGPKNKFGAISSIDNAKTVLLSVLHCINNKGGNHSIFQSKVHKGQLAH